MKSDVNIPLSIGTNMNLIRKGYNVVEILEIGEDPHLYEPQWATLIGIHKSLN